MMADHEVLEAYRGGESDRVEFKASVNADLREAVCALANDLGDSAKPGYLFVGVRDDGSCAGIDVDDRLLSTLAQIRSGGDLQPLPSMTVSAVELDGCRCAAVVVAPSDDPPIKYRGRVWVRVGTSTLVASPQDERILVERRSSRDLPPDHRPVGDATTADLDMEFFRTAYLPAAYAPDVLDTNGRSEEERLVALRFSAGALPTLGGIVVLGRDPQRFIPGAYVQFLAVDGTSITDEALDHKVISGRIDAVARGILELLSLAVPVALTRDDGPTDVKRPLYPISALRELTINALMHRDYWGGNAPVRVSIFKDRIEISNPGGPYGAVRRETFGRGGVTAYRNPVVADALKTLGFAQRFGFGIPFARKVLADNGNPEPEFQVETDYVNVVVRVPQP
jgi:ATP-dependent DNA helicase RecG